MPKFVWPDNVTEERARTLAAIIWTIHEHGPIEDEEGRATSVLMVLLKKQGFAISGSYLAKTLSELDEDGRFGHFVDREMNGKRTYSITSARKPGRDPFPEDPRSPARRVAVKDIAKAAVKEAVEETGPEGEDEIVDDEVVDEEVTISDLDDMVGRVPTTDLALLDAPSRVDRYLYIVSLLNEMITEEVTAPERRFEEQIGERLTAVNAIIEENTRLKRENEGLRDDKRKLAAALEQANSMMRDRASRATNGSREAATVSA